MAEEEGYPYETVLPIPSDYECPICHGILYEPQQIATCGHRFCKKCLQPILRNNPPLCPLDRQTIVVDKVFLDVGCKRTVLGLQVKCLNLSKGCKWTGELSDAQTHRDKCPLEKVKCLNDNCEEMIERRNEEKHRLHECAWRRIKCQHCGKKYAFCQKQDHMDTCQQLPISCLHGCGYLIPRTRMTAHINKECPLTIVKCPYSATGCKATKIKRCELKEHLAQSTQSHLDVTLERQQGMNQEMKLLRNEMERQLQEIKDVKKRLNHQEMQLQEERKRLNEQLKETKVVKERLGNFEKQLYRSQCHGMLIWRIDNYEQRLSDLQTSDPFYSGRYEYKLRCFVKGGESYLKIYIQICRGEFDALLLWPFSRKIKFTLINQTKENNDIVLSFTPQGQDHFQRPKTEYNFGLGIEFAELETIKNGGYFNNNKIFIKVEVEPFDLLGDK